VKRSACSRRAASAWWPPSRATPRLWTVWRDNSLWTHVSRGSATGIWRNDTDNADYFTTAYFHRPDDLCSELEAAGFGDVRILGVEGPAWILPDFDARWGDAALKKDLLDVAKILESESSILGVSAHLLGIGRKP
jgi:hypothetical protein